MHAGLTPSTYQRVFITHNIFQKRVYVQHTVKTATSGYVALWQGRLTLSWRR